MNLDSDWVHRNPTGATFQFRERPDNCINTGHFLIVMRRKESNLGGWEFGELLTCFF
jgi:hypothetical protein